MKASLKRSDPNPQVDWFFAKRDRGGSPSCCCANWRWPAGLKEELKWATPATR